MVEPSGLFDIRTHSGILTLKTPLGDILQKHGVTYRTFEGAVIDLETDEQQFSNEFGVNRYKKFCATCCGILDKNEVEIIAKSYGVSDRTFARVVERRLKKTVSPYYAFNVGCDMASISKLMGREIRFHRELQFPLTHGYEKKRYVVHNLGIPNFDDPFNGEGFLAAKEWTKYLKSQDVDCVKRIIAHNLACVLKEYSILIRRGYREIEPSSYKPFFEGASELHFGKPCRLT